MSRPGDRNGARGRLLTPEEACELLKVNRAWLKRAVHQKRVAHTKLPGSRLLRFYEDDLLARLEANRVEARGDE
jgi:excisionase family DNA binding protein